MAYTQDIQIESVDSSPLQVLQEIHFFRDSSDKLTLNDLKPEMFLQDSVIFFDYYKHNIWVTFKLKNRRLEPVSGYVLVDNGKIENLNGYLVRRDSSIQTYPITGWGKPFLERPYPHYKNIFPFTAKAGETITFYFKINSQYQPFSFPVKIVDKGLIINKLNIITLADGFVLVLSLFIFILSLYLLYDSEKLNLMFLWYSIYSLSGFFYFFLRSGIQYFNRKQLPHFLHYQAELITVIILVSYTLFGLYFLTENNQKNKFPRRLNISILICGCFAIVAYFIPTTPNSLAIFLSRSVLFLLCVGSLLFYLSKGLRKRNTDAYIFSLMFFPLIISYILLFTWTDLAPHSSGFDRALMMKIVVVIEATIMLFSVFYKSKQAKKVLFERLVEKEKLVLQTQIDVQESERKRIASDLHDDIGSTIATAKRLLTELQEVSTPEEIKRITDETRFLISEANDDIRRITHNLMPPNFERLGLKNALQYLVQRAGSKNLDFEFICFGEEVKLDPEKEINLYRITSELIHNVQKHSGASKAAVQLIFYPTQVVITVEDNGTGFKVESHSGLGLSNIKLRVEYIGATVNFDSGSQGTHAMIELRIL